MSYRIDARYVWFNNGTQIVLMYFINSVPFTFDELSEDVLYDFQLISLADNERKYNLQDIYKSSQYLIMEECHPLLFELQLENPHMLPTD